MDRTDMNGDAAAPSGSETASSLAGSEGAAPAPTTEEADVAVGSAEAAGHPLMTYFDTADGGEDGEDGEGSAEGNATVTEPLQWEAGADCGEKIIAMHENGAGANNIATTKTAEERAKQQPPSSDGRADTKETAPRPDDDNGSRDAGTTETAEEAAGPDGAPTEGRRAPPPPPPDAPDPASPSGAPAPADAADVSPHSLLEAERQAAIAAAISANAATASPKLQQQIARAIRSLPGPGDGDAPDSPTVGEMRSSMAGADPGSPPAGGSRRPHPPPPPPPRNQYAAGPTVVALPPVPPRGSPGRAAGRTMRPVRFEDVKAAFARLAKAEEEEEEDGEIGDAEPKDDIGEEADASSTPAPAEEEDEATPAFQRMATEELEGAEEGRPGAKKVDDEPGEPVRKAGGGSGGADAEEGGAENDTETEEGVPSSTGDAAKISAENGPETEGDAAANEGGAEPAPADPASEAPAEEDRATIPDPFLRFLLLVARVPLIVEEPPHPPSPSSSSPSAAAAAARRAHDILCMARMAYGDVSARRRGADGDAAAAFFAACAGEGGEAAEEDLYVEEARAAPEDAGSKDEPARGRPEDAPPTTPPLISATTTPTATNAAPTPLTASSMASSASAVFSNVMSRTSLGKKLMSGGTPGSPPNPHQAATPFDDPSFESPAGSPRLPPPPTHDYEVTIDREMLGLTVENVLERTVIRTLLPDGAAQKAGARAGSLIAKVGNVDTFALTHFETIDELRRSQRPLRLTLRHVGGGALRRAREEMGRLIRGGGGGGVPDDTVAGGDKHWRENAGPKKKAGETFDSVLGNRWPSKANKASSVASAGGGSGPAAPPVLTRAEAMHRAGAELVRILALLVVGLEKELSAIDPSSEGVDSTVSESSSHTGASKPQHLSAKELSESIEITSKILHDYARGLPDIDEKQPRSAGAGGSPGSKPQHPAPGSSFYPVPPGRVQGKRHGGPPSPPPAGRGAGRGRGAPSKSKKGPNDAPLLRIGDALSRTRSFLVESSSATATALRWEIIDHLCTVLDLDTEQELSEKESASSLAGDGGASGPTNDLGSAGSILKLIVLNCSTAEDASLSQDDDASEENVTNGVAQQQKDGDDAETSSLDPSLDQSSTSANNSHAGNPFLSVVHRLAASKSTSARVSACSLGPVLWSHLDFPRQLQLRGVITRALHDVEVIVRKSTAAVLHEIAELVFDRRAVPWLVLMCERSMTDPEPQLRAAAMTLTWHLAEHLPNAFLGDASMGSRSIRRLPPRDSPTFMDVYLLQCKLLPVANNLAEDKIASVRLSVAAQCDRLCNAMGEHWHSVIIDLLQALLSDGDERVRSEAILCVPRLVESVIVGSASKDNITVLDSLLPLALKIQKDASPLVRSSLASATGELLIFLVGLGGSGISESTPPSSPSRNNGTPSLYERHKKHVDDTLIPILQKLLQDSDPEVTTASLRAVTNASRSGTRDTTSTHIPSCHHHNLDDDLVSLSSHQSHHSHASHERTRPVFIPVLSEQQVMKLLPTLSNLANSAQWRVRQSAVEIVPALMGCTSRNETRHEVSKLCLRLMNDKVDAVRKTAAECLCLGGSSLARHGADDGGAWITQICIPHLKTCSQSEDSKQRQLGLKMIEILITNGLCPSGRAAAEQEARTPESPCDDESVSSRSSSVAETPLRTILNIAASHKSDSVANVRLNVGRTFGAVMHFLDKPYVEYAVNALESQLEEEASREGGGDRDVIYFAQQAISLALPFRRMNSIASA